MVREVRVIDEGIEHMAGGRGSNLSTGGMRSKIMAARIATLSGIGVIIASGKDFSVLPRLLKGEDIGTFFYPCEHSLRGKKRWIAFGMIPKGQIVVDEERSGLCWRTRAFFLQVLWVFLGILKWGTVWRLWTQEEGL
jgi:glutamate 5-kinase